MSGMSGHVIICGFGRVGELIAKVGSGVPGSWMEGGSSAGAQVVTAAHTHAVAIPAAKGEAHCQPDLHLFLSLPPACRRC